MKGKWWKVIHWIVIINFVAEILYSSYMVFFVVGGGGWPLFGRAVGTPIEVILKRRLYSVESWIATAGLCIYLAITEVIPKKINFSDDHP